MATPHESLVRYISRLSKSVGRAHITSTEYVNGFRDGLAAHPSHPTSTDAAEVADAIRADQRAAVAAELASSLSEDYIYRPFYFGPGPTPDEVQAMMAQLRQWATALLPHLG